jgi:hypothetical protein
VRAAAVVFLLLTLGSVSDAARTPAVADDAVDDARAATVKALDLQLALPHDPEEDATVRSIEIPSEIIWLAGALAAGTLLYGLLRMIPGWRGRRDSEWRADEAGSFVSAKAIGASLAEADAMAGQGRFVEAMHLLLLHSLAEIRRRPRLEFSDSLTSREILRRAGLPQEVAAALKWIVARVELSYFGDYPATRPDYESCRARYEALTTGLAVAASFPAAGSAI